MRSFLLLCVFLAAFMTMNAGDLKGFDGKTDVGRRPTTGRSRS